MNKKRVVVFIPYGRKATVRMMVPYLLREHQNGGLDEVMLCMNTDRDQEEDRRYAMELQEAFPTLFRVYVCPGPNTPHLAGQVPADWMHGYREPKQMNTMRFYYYMQDRDTYYVRMDDDIVWIDPNAISQLVTWKSQISPRSLGIFPTIINNAVSSYLMQMHGHIPRTWGVCGLNAVDPVGWGNFNFAHSLHDWFLGIIEQDVNASPVWWNGLIDLHPRQQFSVSSFCVSGNEYADLKGVLDWDEEEHWLTQFRTGVVGRVNGVLGSATVAHLTFFTQRRLWDTDVPARYLALAQKVAGDIGVDVPGL